MADQGKWFKLWCSAIHDQELQNLELEDWARWAMLGTYIKEHGKDGKIRFEHPFRALLSLFRMTSITDAIELIKVFPNYTIGERNRGVSPETNTTVSLEIEVTNWFKYQGDLSSTRVRNFRARKRQHETIQEETRSRGDKRRQEESIVPQTKKRFQVPTPEEVTAYAKSISFDLNGSRFCDFYATKGWRVGSSPMKDWKAAVRTWKQKNEEENPSAPNGSEGISTYAAIARANREAQKLREAKSSPEPVSTGVRDLPEVRTKTEAPGRNSNG